MVGQVSAPFDLSQVVVGFLRDGTTHLIQNAPGPPARVNGFSGRERPALRPNGKHSGRATLEFLPPEFIDHGYIGRSRRSEQQCCIAVHRSFACPDP